MNQYVSKSILLLIGLIIATIIHAQDVSQAPSLVYYMAGDTNGVQQVFQNLLDGDNEARQLTHSATDVIRFGVAYDALAIAYISDSQLWLQPIHTDEAESLTNIENTENIWTNPIFSQDGNYIAYADSGVWLYDLANRQTQQILVDVPLLETASNTNEFRVFQPNFFVLDENGMATKLIVNVGKWEWGTAAVYDLSSGELLELDGQLHSDILALSDGRVLIYGNSGVGGEGSLQIAQNITDINNVETVLLFHELTESTLFAEQALEIESDIVRVLGSAISLTQYPDQPLHFYFDFDMNTSEVRGNVQIINLSEFTQAQEVYPDTFELSPDGNHLPLYTNPRFADANIVYGEITILNFVTGETTALETPELVSAFQFQPR